MGVPAPVPKGVRRPSHVAYYVALVGILPLRLVVAILVSVSSARRAMGVPAPVPKGVRRPSHVAYYVALVGILPLRLVVAILVSVSSARRAMGVPAPVPKGVRRPSHVAYYVALVGILSLLIMLCLYFFYYFIKKVKELSSSDTLSLPTASCRPLPAASAYPVQPVVRDSASAMAKLCKQVPPAGKGDTVFPTSTSPAALRASTGEGAPASDAPDATDERPDRTDAEPRSDRTDAEPRPDRTDAEPRPNKAPPAPVVPVVSVTAAPNVAAR